MAQRNDDVYLYAKKLLPPAPEAMDAENLMDKNPHAKKEILINSATPTSKVDLGKSEQEIPFSSTNLFNGFFIKKKNLNLLIL